MDLFLKDHYENFLNFLFNSNTSDSNLIIKKEEGEMLMSKFNLTKEIIDMINCTINVNLNNNLQLLSQPELTSVNPLLSDTTFDSEYGDTGEITDSESYIYNNYGVGFNSKVLFNNTNSVSSSGEILSSNITGSSGIISSYPTQDTFLSPSGMVMNNNSNIYGICNILQPLGENYKKVHGYLTLFICIFGIFLNLLNLIILNNKFNFQNLPNNQAKGKNNSNKNINTINRMLCILAFTDILINIEYIPFTIYMYIYKYKKLQDKYTYGWALYILFHTHFSQILHTISIQLTLSMAIWRYALLRKLNQIIKNKNTNDKNPKKSKGYSMILNKNKKVILKKCNKIIIFAFVLPCIICIPNYFVFSINHKNECLSMYYNDYKWNSNNNININNNNNSSTPSPSINNNSSNGNGNGIINTNHSNLGLENNANSLTTPIPNTNLSRNNKNNNENDNNLDIMKCFNLNLMKIIERQKSTNECPNWITLYRVELSNIAKRNNELLQRIHFWTFSVVVKLGPCIVLTFFIGWLINKLYKTRRKHHKLLITNQNNKAVVINMETNNNSDNEIAVAVNHNNKNDNSIQTLNPSATIPVTSISKTDRTSRMLIAVLILFIVTEFPQGIMGLLSGIYGQQFFLQCYNTWAEIWDLLALLNSAINFILYCFMSKIFRQQFKYIFITFFNLIFQIKSKGSNEEQNNTSSTSLASKSANNVCKKVNNSDKNIKINNQTNITNV